MSDVYDHFSKVAPLYRDLRTTDMEPIMHIVEQLRRVRRIRAADVGCGAGRYDLALLQHLGRKTDSFYCVDISQPMLDQIGDHLSRHRVRGFTTVRSVARNLPFQAERLSCIFTFNAIHHFDALRFLNEASRVLLRNGYLFIYSRLRSQNSQSIWGRYFPQFCEKETRLFEFAELERAVSATPRLRIEHVKMFRYQRVSTLRKLIELVMHRHYSTFAQYSERELSACLVQFEKNIRDRFEDLDRVRWVDQNIMLTIRKTECGGADKSQAASDRF